MKIIIPWSGGLDSSALIYKRLAEGHEVIAVRFELQNNREQSKAEADAVRRIGHILRDDSNFNLNFNDAADPAASIELSFGGYIQPAVWASLLGLYAASYVDIDAVEMAYVMRDDAVSFLPEISKQFRNSHAIAARSDKSCPKISFPLIKLTKSELWDSLPRRIRYFIHFCEYSDRACDRCHSCKRFENEVMDVHDFMLRRDEAVAIYDEERKAKIDEVKAEAANAGDYAELPLEMSALPERGTAAEGDEPRSDDSNL